MSWPIGYPKSEIRFVATRDGGVYADGVRVTDADGWMELEPSAGRSDGDARPRLRVRLRVEADADGCPFLYAEEVGTPARQYSGVCALLMAESPAWLLDLPRVIHAEMERLIVRGVRSGEVLPVSSLHKVVVLGEAPRTDSHAARQPSPTRRPPPAPSHRSGLRPAVRDPAAAAAAAPDDDRWGEINDEMFSAPARAVGQDD